MLSLAQTNRYAAASGIRDITIIETEIIQTYLLQLMADRGFLDRVAFKGGTCIRKLFTGKSGRFSTDLDFTSIEDREAEDFVIDMIDDFKEPFHGIQFGIDEEAYYVTKSSWGVNVIYKHEWNQGDYNEIRLQVSQREAPTMPLCIRPQCMQNYFEHLPFEPVEISCLALPEIIAEKLRACYERSKARDIYDLATFATRPMDHPLVRRLAVLKLWQAGTEFNPEKLLEKFGNTNAWDWEDVRRLVPRTKPVDAGRLAAECQRGFVFLRDLSADEARLAADRYGHEQALWKTLGEELQADNDSKTPASHGPEGP